MKSPADARGILTLAIYPPPPRPVLGFPLTAITDGLSNTVAVTECANRPQLWLKSGIAANSVSGGNAGTLTGTIVSGGPWASDWKGLAPQGATQDGVVQTGPLHDQLHQRLGSVQHARGRIQRRIWRRLCQVSQGDHQPLPFSRRS